MNSDEELMDWANSMKPGTLEPKIMNPTQEQLFDVDGLESVSRIADDSWRHGSHIAEVFHRPADNTFWLVTYDLSTDCETHGLRDGDYQCAQAEAYQETVTKYRAL